MLDMYQDDNGGNSILQSIFRYLPVGQWRGLIDDMSDSHGQPEQQPVLPTGKTNFQGLHSIVLRFHKA